MSVLKRVSGVLSVVAVAALLPISGSQAATYFYHTDHLGTPQALTDENQQVVWRGEQEPFGEVDATTNAVEQNIRFPGQYYDVETGLHYNYFRDYDAGIGRYVQSDPIGLYGGLSTYGYAYQNPTIYTDAYGLNPGAGCLVGSWGGPIGCGVGALVGGLAGVALIASMPGDTVDSSTESEECDIDENEEDDECERVRRLLERGRQTLINWKLTGLTLPERKIQVEEWNEQMRELNYQIAIHNQHCPNHRVKPLLGRTVSGID